MPFGEEIQRASYGGDSVRQKFTGYERDGETDLDFAQARMYANRLGRFTTTDPLYIEAKRVVDPQQVNLYIYGRNNPLKLKDSSGLDIEVSGDAQDEYLKLLQGSVESKKFTITNDKGKLGVKGLDLKDAKAVAKFAKGLKSAGDKALFEAITSGPTAKIEANKTDDGVTFAQFGGKDAKTGEIKTQKLDINEIKMLNNSGITPQSTVAHETLEAWYGAQGNDYGTAHTFAGVQFGGLSLPVRQFDELENDQLKSGRLIFQVFGPGIGQKRGILQANFEFVTPIPKAAIADTSEAKIRIISTQPYEQK